MYLHPDVEVFRWWIRYFNKVYVPKNVVTKGSCKHKADKHYTSALPEVTVEIATVCWIWSRLQVTTEVSEERGEIDQTNLFGTG